MLANRPVCGRLGKLDDAHHQAGRHLDEELVLPLLEGAHERHHLPAADQVGDHSVINLNTSKITKGTACYVS